MTGNEFALWLKGFLAGAGDKLSKEHLDKIQEQLDKVTTAAAPVYVPYPYVPYPYPSWYKPAEIGTPQWYVSSGVSTAGFSTDTVRTYSSS